MKKNWILTIGLIAGAAFAFYMIRKKRAEAADRASDEDLLEDETGEPTESTIADEQYFNRQWSVYVKPQYKNHSSRISAFSYFFAQIQSGKSREEAWKMVLVKFKNVMQPTGDNTRAMGSAGAPLPPEVTTSDIRTLPGAVVNTMGVGGYQTHGGFNQVNEDAIYFIQQWKSRVIPQNTVNNIALRNKVYEIFKGRRGVSVALNSAFDMAVKTYGVKLKN